MQPIRQRIKKLVCASLIHKTSILIELHVLSQMLYLFLDKSSFVSTLNKYYYLVSGIHETKLLIE